MFTGALTLTCLSLAIGQAPQDVWYTNDQHFKIPINMSAQRQKQISQLLLYVSKDKGSNWEQHSTINPSQDGFQFHAPDGEYWFRVALIDRSGKQHPDSPYKGPPNQKMVIDTLQPIVRIVSAERNNNQVIIGWQIQEANPDMKTLTLKYRPAGETTASWSAPVAVPPSLVGSARINVANPNPLEFHLEIADLAKNVGSAAKTVAGVITTTQFQKNAASGAITHQSAKVQQSVPLDHNSGLQMPESPPIPNGTKNNGAGGTIPAPPGVHGNQPVAWGSDNKGPQPVTPEQLKNYRPIATSDNHPPVPGHKVVTKPTKPLPPLQIVNKPEVVVQYELTKVGPAGVGRVELWLTRNDGQTWEGWLKDPTVSPTMRGGKYKRTLKLPGEGVYGLSMVVRNPAGRGKVPENGEVPEMRIEVDMTLPHAVLLAPEPDPDHPNGLVIAWEAKDKNLAKDPVTLEWAVQPSGPWHTIKTNLPHAGRFGKYAWQVPTGTPVYVHLRLRVRDKAGNEAVAVTEQPQLADLTEPEGRLIGVVGPQAGSE